MRYRVTLAAGLLLIIFATIGLVVVNFDRLITKAVEAEPEAHGQAGITQHRVVRFGSAKGQKHGIERVYRYGMLEWERNWRYGKLHGLAVYWDETGAVAVQELYREDVCIEERESPPWIDASVQAQLPLSGEFVNRINGRMMCKWVLSKGVPVGLWNYYRQGVLSEQVVYDESGELVDYRGRPPWILDGSTGGK